MTEEEWNEECGKMDDAIWIALAEAKAGIGSENDDDK